jgi:hypothetical protein
MHDQQFFLDPKSPHAYIVRQTGQIVPDMTKRELADNALKSVRRGRYLPVRAPEGSLSARSRFEEGA